MKIGVVGRYGVKDGIAIYTKYLVEELNKIEIVRVFPLNNPDSNNIFSHLSIILNAIKNSDILHFQERLYGHLWKFSGILTPLIYLFLAIFRKPVITTIHERNWGRRNGVKAKFVRIYMAFIDFFVLSFSDLVIVHTKELKRNLGDKSNVIMIRHGTFEMPKLNKTESKSKLGFLGKYVIMNFGFLDSKKNYSLIIDSLDEINKKMDKEVLLVLAGGPRNERDRALFDWLYQKEKEGKLKIAGFIPEKEIPNWISSADLLVFPYSSVSESGALQIALSCRKPALVSDLGAFKELKEEYSCVELVSDREWELKIVKFLKDKKKQNFLVSRINEYLDKNSWQQSALKHIESYEGILKI
jgi:glycosyltransferase involved in cell wall biosynthesis